MTVRSGIVGLLHDVSTIADHSRSFHQALQSTVERVAREFDWPLGHFFVPGKDRAMEFAGGIRRLETPGGEGLILASQGERYEPGRGWVGKAAERGEPLSIRDLREAGEDCDDPRRQPALDLGLRGLLAAPVKLGDEVLAVMEFFTFEPFQPTAELLDAMAQVSSHLARMVAGTRAQEELRRARELSPMAAGLGEDFFADLSHRIRTPMNAVIGITDLLVRTRLTAEQKEWLETVRSSGAELMTLIDGALNYLKLECAPVELVEEPLSLRGCLEQAIGTVAARAAGKEVFIGYRLPDSIPDALVGDAARLRQILVHLLENAVRFTPQGEIVVTVETAGTPPAETLPRDGRPSRLRLDFAVRDTGVGIAPDHLEHLFQPLSAIDSSTSAERVGTGLGLAVSRKLCRLLGGDLRVESELGRGSVFRFTIELERPAGRTELDRRKVGDAPGGFAQVKVPRHREKPPEILVVEDDPVNQRVAVKMLETLNLKAEVVSSGHEALEVLERHRYDVVLMDVEMPGVDGFETTRRIRRQWPAAEQPYIVAMTARAMPGDREQCLASGMNAYVSKPVTLEALRRALEPR